jgi:hypothetical protein
MTALWRLICYGTLVLATLFLPWNDARATLCSEITAILSAGRQEIAKLDTNDIDALDGWADAHPLTGVGDCSLTVSMDEADVSCSTSKVSVDQANNLIASWHSEINRCLDQSWCRMPEWQNSRVNRRTGNTTLSLAYEYRHYYNRRLDSVTVERGYIQPGSGRNAWVSVDILAMLKPYTERSISDFLPNNRAQFTPEMKRKFDNAPDCHAFALVKQEQFQQFQQDLQQDLQQGREQMRRLEQLMRPGQQSR